MIDKNKNNSRNEVVFAPGNGAAYARVYFPDEAAARAFVTGSVPEGVKRFAEQMDFNKKTEVSMGEHGRYGAWVGVLRRHDDHDVRQLAVDIRDMYATDSERIDQFRDFVLSHAGVEEPDQI